MCNDSSVCNEILFFCISEVTAVGKSTFLFCTEKKYQGDRDHSPVP